MATPNASNERQALEMKYKNARGNLLIVIAFTLVNIILLLIKSDSFFYFLLFFLICWLVSEW